MSYAVPQIDMHVVDWFDGTTAQNYIKIISTITRDYSATFKYKDLLPKITLKNFILSIQNALNVCFHFRHLGKVDIIDRESIITGDVTDLSKYMLNTWEMGERKNLTLKFAFTHDNDDTFFKERWTDIDDRRRR